MKAYEYLVKLNERGSKTTICWRGNITIEEMLKKYLNKKRKDLSQMHNYKFLYNGQNLNAYEFINKTVESVFRHYPSGNILVIE